MDTIALKVKTYSSIAKVISIIRKYSSLSIRRCYDELLKAGIECDIYDEDEEVISRQIVSNWIETLRGVEKDTMAQMAAEGDDSLL